MESLNYTNFTANCAGCNKSISLGTGNLSIKINFTCIIEIHKERAVALSIDFLWPHFEWPQCLRTYSKGLFERP